MNTRVNIIFIDFLKIHCLFYLKSQINLAYVPVMGSKCVFRFNTVSSSGKDTSCFFLLYTTLKSTISFGVPLELSTVSPDPPAAPSEKINVLIEES